MGAEGAGFEGLPEVQDAIIISTFHSITYSSSCLNRTILFQLIYLQESSFFIYSIKRRRFLSTIFYLRFLS